MKTLPNDAIQDETAYLNSSRRNRELLEAAIREAKQGGGIHVTPEELVHASDPSHKIETIHSSKDAS